MKKLCYKTLEEMNFDGYLLKDAPERILQFGEGNFLRAFVDYFVDMMRDAVSIPKSFLFSPLKGESALRNLSTGRKGSTPYFSGEMKTDRR